MRGEDAQTRIVERAEEREGVSLRRVRTDFRMLGEIVQTRLVTMVAVSDVHALIAQR